MIFFWTLKRCSLRRFPFFFTWKPRVINRVIFGQRPSLAYRLGFARAGSNPVDDVVSHRVRAVKEID